MLIEMSDGWKLLVFEEFRVDHDLPKFRATTEAELEAPNVMGSSDDFLEMPALPSPMTVRSSRPPQRQMRRRRMINHRLAAQAARRAAQPATRPPWYRRTLDALWRALIGEKAWERLTDSLALGEFRGSFSEPQGGFADEDPRSEDPPLGVLEFFSAVKGAAEHLERAEERAVGFAHALHSARAAGQVALIEQLTGRVDAVRAETRLLAIGFDKYLTEETLVEFARKSDRGVRLDWVSNFTRIIPPNVVEKKVQCDADHIFDAWVVLHYDPEGKATVMTAQERKEEVARKRDPILFGLLEGSRRLYYIADWDDEYCDLTLEKVADILGADPSLTLRPDDFLGHEPPTSAVKESSDG